MPGWLPPCRLATSTNRAISLAAKILAQSDLGGLEHLPFRRPHIANWTSGPY
jgi:hypothetical protein